MAGKRIAVAKTYKIYIGGKFPRTESGTLFSARGCKRGNVIANMSVAAAARTFAMPSLRRARHSLVVAGPPRRPTCGGKSFIASPKCSKVVATSSWSELQSCREFPKRRAAEREVNLSIDQA